MTISGESKQTKPYVAVAPMMDWTDRHCRYFHRLISPSTWLFTEMVTTGALIHGDKDRFLRYDHAEHPVALQLGGSDPDDLARCAVMGEEHGYDEINLNCGCPSDRVQKGKIGACLMAEPDLVAKCIHKMIESTSISVTVKCRIAIDEYEEEPFLEEFLTKVSEAGCQTFTIHARKAWLSGLSPKENRDIPPLRYDIVKSVKAKFPDIKIMLNGGITSIDAIQTALQDFDGVMIGREAYQNPYILSEIEQKVFDQKNIITRFDAAQKMIPYIEKQQDKYGTPIKSITRHMIGLFQGQVGAKKWRRYLSENAHKSDNAKALIEDALALVLKNQEKSKAA